MRAALADCPDVDRLETDFYDRTRLAGWVREHPGIVVWTREKAGRAISGWQPYSNWSAPDQTSPSEYLVDDRVRFRFQGTDVGVSANEAIARLRDMLRRPGTPVRLVGLSGVGKTRLVQALFEGEPADGALPAGEVIYTDFHEHLTSPQPEAMAADLLAQGRQAILIIDNCGGDTHERLAKLCLQPGCTLRILTVEYDVQGGEPENTRTVEMDTASDLLIERLIRQRHRNMTRENVQTIVHVSGGNARIALYIAGTVRRGDKLAGLAPGVIFDRLFRQRNPQDDTLLRAAEVCSLLFSFDGETEVGSTAELPVLAQLAEMGEGELYRHIHALRQRGLVQTRVPWHAVLPHALANHLAANALGKIRRNQLRRHLIEGGNQRLLRSFTHRLSYLHNCAEAVTWCEELLQPGGRLGQLLEYDYLQFLMLSYMAPVAPAHALAAIERAANENFMEWLDHSSRFTEQLRLIAWDPSLFGRCVDLLERIVRANRHRIEVEGAQKILTMFCQVNRSGTHAPVAVRFELIASWINDADPGVMMLGRHALGSALKTQVSLTSSFNFGSRTRNDGYRPGTTQELADWYARGLSILEHLAQPSSQHADFARKSFAKNFCGLWNLPLLRDRLTQLLLSLTEGAFWREGWLSVRKAIRESNPDIEGRARLRQLESQMAPKDLASRVLGTVLTSGGVFLTQGSRESWPEFQARIGATINAVGHELAREPNVLGDIALQLLTRGGRMVELGSALAQVDGTHQQVWEILTPVLARVLVTFANDAERPRLMPHLLQGFIQELSKRDRVLTERCLSQCSMDPGLAPILPALQAAAEFDKPGFVRLQLAFEAGLIPLVELDWLRSAVSASDEVQHMALAFLSQISALPGGALVAVHALQSWLNLAERPGAIPGQVLIQTCQSVLWNLSFVQHDTETPIYILRVAELGLQGEGAADLAASLAARLAAASRSMHSTYVDYEDLIVLLVNRQPEAVLSAMCQGDLVNQALGIELLRHQSRRGEHPIDKFDPQHLAAWCNADPVNRIPFAMRIVNPVGINLNTGRACLTPQMLALLQEASDPRAVLERLIEELDFLTWGTSNATIKERYAYALDSVIDKFDAEFQMAAREGKDRLLAQANEMQRLQSNEERAQNQRFEQ